MIRHIRALAGALLAVVLLAGCATSPTHPAGSAGPIQVAASVNAWGSILAQLGGNRVHETSIITSPATDPHDYEPSPADARIITTSRLFVENGIGYDPWAAQTVRANPDPARTIIDIGQITGIQPGGNPHRWYSPNDVAKVADAITAALTHVDPAGAGYYTDRRRAFETTGLADYHRLIADIRAHYAGTPVGASESIFAPLADALGLNLITPPGFLKAISEGTDPSTADKATIDTQIREHKITIYVFNSQNSTPDVAGQVAAAHASGIPVIAVTETLTPATATFQQWQTSQLRALQAALKTAVNH
jgi:zinc/manganese transport system substrate-binding protein